MKKLAQQLNDAWYSKHKPQALLRLIAAIYCFANRIHTLLGQSKRPRHFPIPVIVIGNLSVGGTGKTPAVIACYQHLSALGFRVAIVTRGYKNILQNFPHLVDSKDTAELIGDEAFLIYQKTKAPIWIAKKRLQALNAIAQKGDIEIIISDDGLQHHVMPRQIECVVVDGTRGFGNGYCLPAGPLRERTSRLASVDFILINGKANQQLKKIIEPYQMKCFDMSLVSSPIYALNPNHQTFEARQGKLAAFAGIGHPERFFTNLRNDDILFTPYPFPDHHRFEKKDFDIPESCIIMTEKDAVKCVGLSDKAIYVLPVTADFPITFWQQLQMKLRTVL